MAASSARRIPFALGLAAFLGALAGGAVGLALAWGAAAGGSYAIVADGLEAPRGLHPLPNGRLLIAEGGGRISELGPDGELRVIVDSLPSARGHLEGGEYVSGPSAAALFDGAYYFVVGEFRDKGFREAYRYVPGGTPERLTDQDPTGLQPPNLLTNPYDLAIDPDGALLISDAGINAILRVSPDGALRKYADIASPTGAEPPGIDSVPTGIARGTDGALYVGTLTGYPYPSGAASVRRMEDLNGDGDAMDKGETTTYASGFTAVTDVAFDTDGSLLATEFSNDLRRLVDEFGYERSADFPGRLVRWRSGAEPLEVVADGLDSPTAVAVGADGGVYVSEEFAGRVLRVGDAPPAVLDSRYPLVGVALGAGLAVIAAYAARQRGWRAPLLYNGG